MCHGGGIYVGPGSRPSIINVIIYNCDAYYGAGIYCADSSAPYIADCQFIYNTAIYRGGAIYAAQEASPQIENCLFIENVAMELGGAALFYRAGRINLERCLFDGNRGPVGCAIVMYSTRVKAVNCTFVNNTGEDAVIFVSIADLSDNMTNLHIENSILSYNDVPMVISTYTTDTTVTLLTYTDISNNTGGDWTGLIQGQLGLYGNICEDPLYVDISQKNYHLSEDSPCIDAGNPNSPLDPDSTIADMGVYYYHQTTTGINYNQSSNTEVKAFPNPFNDHVTFSIPSEKPSQISVSIFGLKGEHIHTIISEKVEMEYTLQWHPENLPPGIYVYHIRTENCEASGKIIKGI